MSPLLFIRVHDEVAWLGVLLNASHAPIFACVAVLIFEWPGLRADRDEPGTWPDWQRAAMSLAIAVFLGVLVELLQSFEGRQPSLFDVATDAAGAVLGLATWSLLGRRGARAGRSGQSPAAPLLVSTALVAIAFVLWQPVRAALAYAHRAASFPVIAEFARPADLYFVAEHGSPKELSSLPAPWSHTPGEKALRIRYDAEHGPAVRILEPAQDWRGYSLVALDLTNPAPVPMRLTFRIFDAHHDRSHADRLNLPLVIGPRARVTIRVALSEVEAAPATRPMDMAAIADVMLFGRKSDQEGDLYVSRIWLE